MSRKETQDLINQVHRLRDNKDSPFFAMHPCGTNETWEACEALLLAGKSLLRWAERQCNGIERYDAKLGRCIATWTEADDAVQDRAQARAETKAMNALRILFGDKLGALGVEFQRDPRGAMIKVYRPGEQSSGNPALWV